MDGAVNGDVFAVYLDQVLGPTLRPGDVVVLDNLSVHKGATWTKLRKNTGCACATCRLTRRTLIRLNSLSASSKRGCARSKARTRDLLGDTILTAAAWITEQDAKNWFDHCGYHVP